jgi:hypothetical protein
MSPVSSWASNYIYLATTLGRKACRLNTFLHDPRHVSPTKPTARAFVAIAQQNTPRDARPDRHEDQQINGFLTFDAPSAPLLVPHARSTAQGSAHLHKSDLHVSVSAEVIFRPNSRTFSLGIFILKST